MQKTILVIYSITMTGLLWIGMGCSADNQKVSNEAPPVALVNGKPIKKALYDRELEKARKVFGKKGPVAGEDQKDKLENKVLEDLINREVLFQESVKQGVTIDNKEIEKQFEILRSNYSDEDKWQELLDNWNFSEEEMKTEIGRRAAVQHLLKTEVEDKINISDEELKKFYDDNPDKFIAPPAVKVRQILLRVDPKNDDEAKKKAIKKKLKELKARLEKGEDFAELAGEFSEGPEKLRGGDLGFIDKGMAPKQFEDFAFSIPIGKVSDVIETEMGYHLIKVSERRPAKKYPFEEIKPGLKAYLKNQKIGQASARYIKKLKESAKIVRKIK